MIYNRASETMPGEDIEQLQIERLQMTLNRVYRNVAFYREAYDAHGVNIEKVKSLRDLRELPFTTKEDLVRSYPYGMFAVPLRDIVRIHSSSGTTGQQIVMGYTVNDIRNWSELVARLLTGGGVTNHDLVQISLNYSLFTGGFGYHYGAEKIGASVIPASVTGDIEKQIMIMKDYKTTALVSTPSYALMIANAMSEMNIHPDTLFLKSGLFSAEPWSEGVRARIEEKLHIVATDNYGLSEVMGPGVSGECQEKNGLHVNEDHFIVELVDPKTLEPLGPGVEGELIFTTITKEGFPLIRYRTGDMASLLEGDCACGRTFVRMSRVTGRCDDMLLVNGVKVYPSQIEDALMKHEATLPPHRIIISRDNETDRIEIQVAIPGEIVLDEMKNLLHYQNQVQAAVESAIGMSVKITLAEPSTLGDGNGKSRVVDRR
jgi:phenylacetate-CoA ligase